MYLTEHFNQIAIGCAEEVVKPKYAGCCGMAGDRGFYYPELTDAATKMEIDELLQANTSNHYASACTCEIALSKSLGKRFEHIAYLMDEVSN